jgi:hypothetical protein
MRLERLMLPTHYIAAKYALRQARLAFLMPGKARRVTRWHIMAGRYRVVASMVLLLFHAFTRRPAGYLQIIA